MSGLTIGEVAEQAKVHIETLRYYERRGLVARPPQSASNDRRYPEEAMRRVRFIKHGQELGFSLDDIKELLSLRADPEAGCAEVRAYAEAKITGLHADTSAPWVQLEVRYPVQPWNWMVMKPAANSISQSDRSQMAPDTQSDQVPMPASCAGVTCSSSKMSAICRRPPGRSTRYISATTLGLSRHRLNTPFVITTSTVSAGTGSASARPSWKSRFDSPTASAFRRALASIASTMSTPMT